VSELIPTLQRGSKRSLLAQALGELGRIPKTLHLLTFIDDPCYRRDILTQLTVVRAVIGSFASAFMASVETSGSGIARVKKINSAPWVW
jgi:TnpA family transposase